jgi:hypothetical protein
MERAGVTGWQHPRGSIHPIARPRRQDRQPNEPDHEHILPVLVRVAHPGSSQPRLTTLLRQVPLARDRRIRTPLGTAHRGELRPPQLRPHSCRFRQGCCRHTGNRTAPRPPSYRTAVHRRVQRSPRRPSHRLRVVLLVVGPLDTARCLQAWRSCSRGLRRSCSEGMWCSCSVGSHFDEFHPNRRSTLTTTPPRSPAERAGPRTHIARSGADLLAHGG